jgi:hypothetical protein
MTSPSEIMRSLNNIAVGPLAGILQRLDRARRELDELGLAELAQSVHEARAALLAGQEPLFQKRVAHVASRLGHLKRHEGAAG